MTTDGKSVGQITAVASADGSATRRSHDMALASAEQAIARAEMVVTLQTIVVESAAAAGHLASHASGLLATMKRNLDTLYEFRARLL
jgi:hypothetical protein